ncbi:hypothetical protein [Nioella sp.]|uniref:hypothetical protein n=1 Tax=Nioella sp. TaxID=1912091 RepID=UPI00351402CD
MTRIALTHVAYDARRACFHARAVVDGRPAVDCRWSGPQSADFDRVASGLAQEARRHAV